MRLIRQAGDLLVAGPIRRIISGLDLREPLHAGGMDLSDTVFEGLTLEIQAHLNPGCRVPTPPPVRVPTYDAGTSADPLTQWPVNVLTPATATLASAKNCAVHSITTTLYRTVDRFRTSVDIPSIRLADDVDD